MIDASRASSREERHPARILEAPVLAASLALTGEGTDAEVLGFLELAAMGGAQVHALTKKFLRVNNRFAAMVGYTPEELRQMGFPDLAPPDESASNPELFARLVRGDTASVSLEKQLRRKDGTTFWVSLTAGMIRDRAELFTRIVAVVQDITERKRRELNVFFLNEVQDDFARLTDVGDMVAIVGQKICRRFDVRRVSFVALDSLGHPRALGEHANDGDPRTHLGREDVWNLPDFPADKFLPELNAGRPIAIDDVTSDSRTRRVAESMLRLDCAALLHVPHTSNGQCKFILAAGHDRPRTWSGAEIELMRDLASRAWLSVERAWAEQALRESEARLRRATQIDTVGILFFDLAGGITDANDAFLRMSGYSREELRLGLLRWDRMTPAEWMPHSLEAIEQFKTHGRTRPYEKQYVRKDGSRWWGLFSATRLADNEGVEFVVDITERKNAEEQLRKYQEQLEERVLERTAELDSVNGALRDEILERERSEAARQALMGQLVAVQEEERRRISRELHDVVGQHLTALMLGLKALEDRPVPWSAPEVLDDLQRLTEAIGKEIHDLALELRPTALDDLGLAQTLSNYIGNWSARARVEVDFHSSGWGGERLPSQIETTLFRIVCEALTNVLKHAAAQHVSVILERRLNQAVAIVEDDGKGFDAECVRAVAGQRLGLTGMQERAALVGGELNIESEPGHGTTVFVRIPLHPKTEAKRHG